jgi:phosphotransacetylase
MAVLGLGDIGAPAKHPQCEKVRRAVEMLHRADPALMADGELRGDDAVSG